jgi:hypothetical protein
MNGAINIEAGEKHAGDSRPSGIGVAIAREYWDRGARNAAGDTGGDVDRDRIL